MHVSIYLWDHSHGCKSHQPEGQGRGLRVELLMQSFVAGKVLRLGGTKCLLGSGRQVWDEAEVHGHACVFVSLSCIHRWWNRLEDCN